MPKAERDIYVEIPDEDPSKKDGMIGKLLRTWYGTQDASNLWQKHYTDLIGKLDYTPGVSKRAVFYSKVHDARMLVHGDDFAVVARQALLELITKSR